MRESNDGAMKESENQLMTMKMTDTVLLVVLDFRIKFHFKSEFTIIVIAIMHWATVRWTGVYEVEFLTLKSAAWKKKKFKLINKQNMTRLPLNWLIESKFMKF